MDPLDNSNLIMKKEEDENEQEKNIGRKSNKEEWKCLDCKKSYKSYPAFYTHNKLKHDGKPPQHYDIPRSLEDIRKDRGRPRVTDSSQRIKFTIQDKHQQKCEDNIYEFLGKLGQKGDDNGTHDNTVIRGYLKKPLDPDALFPLDSFKQNEKMYEYAVQLKKNIGVLCAELAKQTQWEFVDPLDLKPDEMNEFSIYNLKALFHNLRQKNLNTNYTTLSVYLTWVSKELLEEAYKEIVFISLSYCIQYWEAVWPIYESRDPKLSSEEFTQIVTDVRMKQKEIFINNIGSFFQQFEFSRFDQNDARNYIEKFLAWYFHFDDNEITENTEQLIKDNQDSGPLDDDDVDEVNEDVLDQNRQPSLQGSNQDD